MARTSDTHPIRVDFIDSPDFPVLNRIGMTFAPGKKQAHPLTGEAWDRDLLADVARLKKEYGTDVLVSLIEYPEFEALQITELWRHCDSVGIHVHNYSIPDQNVPSDIEEYRKEIKALVDQLESGKRMVIHCKGGLGRTGTVAACMAIAASDGNISGDEAIALVRRSRVGAIENMLQENFVRGFSMRWLARRTELEFLLPQQATAECEDIFIAGGLGDGACIQRFKASDGEWYYHATSTIEVTLPGESEPSPARKGEPMSSLTEVLESVFGDGTVFGFYISLLHPDYESEVRAFAERRLASLDEDEKDFYNRGTEPLSVDAWMERSRQIREAFASDDDDDEQLTEFAFGAEHLKQRERTGRNFLLYWKFQSIVAAASNPVPLDVISSRQLGRVASGDRIWIVTVDGGGRLLLAGQMKVGRIVDRDEAVRATGSQNLWDGNLFALPDASEAPEAIHILDIHHIAPELRFGEDGTGRFNLSDARVNIQELQQMRDVTPETSELLYREWELHNPFIPLSSDEEEEEFDELEDEASEEDLRAFIAEGSLMLRDNPNDVDLLYNLGLAHGRLGDTAKEIEYYNRVLIIYPEHVASRFNLGCAYANLNEPAKARDEFRVLTDADLYHAPAYFMLGTMLSRLGNYDEAIHEFRRGLEIDPDDPGAYINMAEALLQIRRFGEAATALEKACELWPDNPDPCYQLGLFHRAMGDKQKELEAYLEAVRRNEMIMDHVFAAGTAWAHLYGGPEGQAVEYYLCGTDFMLDEPKNFFYLGLGIIAQGFVNDANDMVTTLRDMGSDLADKLERFIAIAENSSK